MSTAMAEHPRGRGKATSIFRYMLYKHATRVPTSQKDTLQACPFFKVHERSECTFDYKNERSEFL